MNGIDDMSEQCFVISDKNERVIKKDQAGMLCIFDTEPEAKRYLRNINQDDARDCEIVRKEQLTFK